MAKYTAADCRLCRRENQKLFLKGDSANNKNPDLGHILKNAL